jgi:hypothetical protein
MEYCTCYIVLSMLYVLLYTYNERIGNIGEGYEARESCPAAGFRGRAKASAGTYAGVAGILQADQEGSDVASGCRRSGMVPRAGTRLPDEN